MRHLGVPSALTTGNPGLVMSAVPAMDSQASVKRRPSDGSFLPQSMWPLIGLPSMVLTSLVKNSAMSS